MTIKTPALMLQGTASGVGKSVITAAICRCFVRRGLTVAPFKPQNMANNAAVADDGGEIGRAQALQAFAARIPSTRHMNPVLLKPQGGGKAQVVVQGRRWKEQSARDYWGQRGLLITQVLESFHETASKADLVLIEGAGSASEVNLRTGDIANMGFAEAADVPVMLMADIRRGGVIASLVGTSVVIRPDDCKRIRGFIVNRFAGDPSLFDSGVDMITAQSGWPCFGVIPECERVRDLPDEDSAGCTKPAAADFVGADVSGSESGTVVVAVPQLRHRSNIEDIDPLRYDPRVHLIEVAPGERIPRHADAVLLIGTKSTRAELDHLRSNGWFQEITAFAALGGSVLGICGGYQMIGKAVIDETGVDGEVGSSSGLGLLDTRTVLGSEKVLKKLVARHVATGISVRGYEMHVGRTDGADAKDRPLFALKDGLVDGACSLDGRVMGTMVHGVLANDAFRSWWITRLLGFSGKSVDDMPDGVDPAILEMADAAYWARIDAAIDALADVVEKAVKVDQLYEIAKSR